MSRLVIRADNRAAYEQFTAHLRWSLGELKAGEVIDRGVFIAQLREKGRMPSDATLYRWLVYHLGNERKSPRQAGGEAMARHGEREHGGAGPKVVVDGEAEEEPQAEAMEMGARDTLKPKAVDLVPTMRDGELRIRDEDLATRLGYGRPREIRPLIARHRAALSSLGILSSAGEIVGKGQVANVYYLNRRQAIYLTAKSETPEATAITIEIVRKFDAYENGAAQPAIDLNDPVALRGLLLAHAEQNIALRAEVAGQKVEIVELKEEVAGMKPTVEAMQRFRASKGALGVRIVSAEMGVPMNDLTAWLERNRWAYRNHPDGPLIAYRDKIQAGLLEMKPTTKGVDKVTGELRRTTMLRITPMGQSVIMEAMLMERQGRHHGAPQQGRLI